MRLWEAILSGSRIRGQAEGAYFAGNKSCAMGAAMEALGCEYASSLSVDSMERTYPFLFSESTCPECRDYLDIYTIITGHLNDDHGWTRERIALDFVRPIEERPGS